MNDEEEKIVYVLGAGFSENAGCPLTKDFLNYEHCNTCQFEKDSGLLGFDRLLKLYLSYRKFMEICSNGDIEYFAQYIGKKKRGVWHIDKEEVNKYCPALSERDIPREIKKGKIGINYLQELIGRYYLNIIHNRLNNNQKGFPEIYERFFDTFKSAKQDSIITFNYDYLPEIFLNDYLKGFDYCLSNTDIKIDKKDSSINNLSINNKVIKLHGSINWFYCYKCNKLMVDKIGTPNAYDYNDIEEYYDCTEDCKSYDKETEQFERNTRQLLILPPGGKNKPSGIFNKGDKEEPRGIFEVLMEEAKFELENADKIIVIGYQLPKIDKDAKNLFDHNYTNYKSDVKVEIYNSRNNEEPIKNRETFEKLFPKDSIVKSKHGYLEDYVNNIGVK